MLKLMTFLLLLLVPSIYDNGNSQSSDLISLPPNSRRNSGYINAYQDGAAAKCIVCDHCIDDTECYCDGGSYLHNGHCIKTNRCEVNDFTVFGQCLQVFPIIPSCPALSNFQAQQYCLQRGKVQVDIRDWHPLSVEAFYQTTGYFTCLCTYLFTERHKLREMKEGWVAYYKDGVSPLTSSRPLKVSYHSVLACPICLSHRQECCTPLLIDLQEDTPTKGNEHASARTRQDLTCIPKPTMKYDYHLSATFEMVQNITVTFVNNVYIRGFMYVYNYLYNGYYFDLEYWTHEKGTWTILHPKIPFSPIDDFHLGWTEFKKSHFWMFDKMVAVKAVRLLYETAVRRDDPKRSKRPAFQMFFELYGCEVDATPVTAISIHVPTRIAKGEGNFLILVNKDAFEPTVIVTLGDLNATQYTIQRPKMLSVEDLIYEQIPDAASYATLLTSHKAYIVPYTYAEINVTMEYTIMAKAINMVTRSIVARPVVFKIGPSCVPKLRIGGLTNDYAHPETFANSYRIRIDAHYWDCPERIITSSLWQWTVFSIKAEVPFPLHATMVNLSAAIDTHFSVFSLPSESLGAGAYYIEVVSNTTLHHPPGEETLTAGAYVHLTAAHIFVTLHGGASRTINILNDVKFTATATNDIAVTVPWSTRLSCQSKIFNENGATVYSSDTTGSGFTVPPGTLIAGSEYRLTTTVTRIGSSMSGTSTQKLIAHAGPVHDLVIRCLVNCGGSLNIVSYSMKLSLTADCLSCPTTNTLQYEWELVSAPGNKKQSLDWETETRTGSRRLSLVILPNVLLPGERYTIGLSGNDISGASVYTSVSIQVTSPPAVGSCKATPDAGYALKTEIIISCSGFTDPTGRLKYSFYLDSQRKNLLFMGFESTSVPLMFPKPDSSEIHTVIIDVSNMYLAKRTVHVSIAMRNADQELSGSDESVLDVVEKLTSIDSPLEQRIGQQNMPAAVNILSSIVISLNTDVKTTTDNKDRKRHVRDNLMEVVHKMRNKVNSMNVLSQLVKASTGVLDDWEQVSSSSKELIDETFTDMANNFLKMQSESDPDEVELAAESLVLGAALMVKANSDTGQLNHSHSALNVIDAVTEGIHKTISPNENPVEFTHTNLALQLRKSFLTGNMLIKTKMPVQDGGVTESKVELPDIEVLKAALSSSSLANQPILTQTVLSHHNPYTGSASSDNVATPVYSVNIKRVRPAADNNDNVTTTLAAVEFANMTSPLMVSLPVLKSSTTLGEMLLVYNSRTGKALPSEEEKVTVVTFSLNPSQPTMIGVMPNPLSVSVKILMKEKLTENDTVLTAEFAFSNMTKNIVDLSIPNSIKTIRVAGNTGYIYARNTFMVLPDIANTNRIYVIGIAPVEEQVINSSVIHSKYSTRCQNVQCKSIINITVLIGVGGCVYFDHDAGQWTSDGCQLAPTSQLPDLTCMCNHMSDFAGSVFVMPNMVSPLDIHLFGTFFDNPVVVVTVVSIWLLYLLLVLWARKKDKRDVIETGVTMIPNPVPGCKYLYLIGVVTGMRHNSGTSANVFIYLVGSCGSSIHYALHDVYRPRFQAGSQNWFAITTKQSLGVLRHVCVWHDNSGENPSWFLKEVIVKDLQTDQTLTFVYDDWLGLDRPPGEIRAELPGVSSEELQKNHQYQFWQKSSSDLCNNHLWLSIFVKPAFSRFTRVQRLSCALTLLLSAMLTNIMFFGIPTDDPDDQIGQSGIVISLSALAIGLETALIMFPINLAVIQLFSKVGSRPSSHKASHYNKVANVDTTEFNNSSKKKLFVVSETQNDSFAEIVIAYDNISKKDKQTLMTKADEDKSHEQLNTENYKIDSVLSFGAERDDMEDANGPKAGGSDDKEGEEVDIIQLKDTLIGNNDSIITDSLVEDTTDSIITESFVEDTDSIITESFVDDTDSIITDKYGETGQHETKKVKTITKFRNVFKRRIKKPKDVVLLMDDGEKVSVKKKPFKLPWWFIYIAWTICISTSLICSFFVMLYGLKFGYSKSVEWLVAFFTSFLTSALITQPLKVFVIAMLITLILKKPVEQEESNLDFNLGSDEELLQQSEVDSVMHSEGWERYVGPAPVQEPLSSQVVSAVKKHVNLQWRMNALLTDLVLYFTFVMVVHVIAHGHRDVNTCYLSTKAIENMFVHGKYTGKPYLCEVLTPTIMWDYMNRTFFANIYAYNQGTTYQLMTSDKTSILVGSARLRQVRVNNDTCEDTQNNFTMLFNCTEPFSYANEDSYHYQESWTNRLADSDLVAKGSMWTYNSAWELKTIPLIGQVGLYSGGGYYVELPLSSIEQEQLVDTINTSSWIDKQTRAVFLEFNIYNPSTDLFSIVVLMFEFSPLGAVLPSHFVFTCKLSQYTGPYEQFVGVCEVLFVFYSLLFTYYEIKRFRQTGRAAYLTDPWNYVEFVIITLCFTSIGLYFERMVVVSSVMKAFHDGGGKTYNSFYPATVIDYALNYVLGGLVLLSILKVIKLFKFNKKMSVLGGTLVAANRPLRNFFFISLLFLFAFCHFAVLVFGATIQNYNNILDSILTLFNFALGVSDFGALAHSSRVLGPVFFLLFVFFVQMCLLSMLVTIILEAFSTTMRNIEKLNNEYELLEYIYKQFLNVLGKSEKLAARDKGTRNEKMATL